jgi:enolase
VTRESVLDIAILDFLVRAGLAAADQTPHLEPLAGGVSSDIWVVRTPSRVFCVKRALPRLRVSAEWRADITRNAAEVAWLKHVAQINRDLVPTVLASDRALGAFAMEFLPPADYQSWKTRLARGVVDARTAADVGRQLASIHSAFAKMPSAPVEFDTGPAFHSLRLEPYLLATARVHPGVASALEELSHDTAHTKLTVVHGDISPKNILLGPRGPVFLDAECAWFGDPAFDLAFCLNHLLLKTMWVPMAEVELLESFGALASSYLAGADWEPAADVERRAARLLPGLLLARIDGKSPVEYLTDDVQKETVRQAALSMLKNPVGSLDSLRRAWVDRKSRMTRGARRPADTKIDRVVGRRVWDSRGRPTVEAEVFLQNGVSGRAIAPAGASTGRNEAVELRDSGSAFGGLGVDGAVRNISGEISSELRGLSVEDQQTIDKRLIELDGTPAKSRLGANATVAVSMAALHAAAAAQGRHLWRYLAGNSTPRLPMPMIQIFGGGVHAHGRVDIQDFMIVPVGASTFDHAVAISAEVYDAAGRLMAERGRLRGVADEGGLWPEFASNSEALETLVSAIERARLRPAVDVGIAIDVAATQLRRNSRYRLSSERRELTTEELIDMLLAWCGKYPIVSIEDPVAEDDHEGMRAFTARAGDRLQIVGDDYLVTSSDRIAAAAAAGACNAVLLKPNQVGTITETAAALAAARAAGWSAIVSARSGETEDVTIVHLAVGWDVGQLKVGSCTRGERTAKWNEGVRVEQALGASARLARGPRH